MNINRITLLFLLCMLSACKKENLSDYPDFMGIWYGESETAGYSLTIGASGEAIYEKTTNSIPISAYGKFKLYKDVLKIGRKRLKVNQYPSYDSEEDTHTMEIDGIVYFK